ncbi:SAC3/GANP/Nin1/mts3/eIF-3 p25 family-domain-containing protein [Alternaria rosae]|uniref:SAC3/GANP/Nin1/mts3/eIF-3 p25 family-domain-containing protein n=1 Tax=Alternaria rosae TaxID=1187941 RepID=UPI001E8E6AAE|nr:SAC3/GANP/Nin1/mts3/eIF-3 p25 family-domain-containing protein [Alternaria rosae]KAH6866349.1 SAC3/GANP/Nin1/mts3/eIF-3 p25 family-domain-containing protein [Alternaria rosae]
MNPEGQMRLVDSVKLYGLCQEMCPEYERVRRIVELDVKAPECTPETQHLPSRSQRIADESRMVKAYARSAAGMDVELVSEIRSPATCLKTLRYLYGRLDEDDFQFLHSWLWDRTRAVRKDLRTQRIENRADIAVLLTSLEYSARFYMLSAHHMARSTKDDYSHQQDVEQLNQTLISLKERYADNRRANIISECEAEFWAYRLILAPIYANTQLENELHRLPSDLRNNPRVQTALEIFRLLKSIIIHRNYDNWIQCQSNWKRFWELIKSPRVSYLMACAAAISFNRVRHVALDVVWRCYRVGLYRHQVPVEFWTTDRLREVLGMDTEDEAVEFCEAHGFVFEFNEAGQRFMDIKQKHYDRKANVLAKADIKPQFFSATIVEAKRCGRPLSTVIAGMTVQEAKKGGLSAAQAQQMEDQTSLFVPETASVFRQQPTEATPSAGGFSFNATSSPFQSNGTSATTPNPFARAVQPGLFDPSKNSIQFGQPADANANPFLRKDTNSFQSTPPAPSSNPFLKNNTTQPESTTPQTAANPFLKFNNGAKSDPTAAPTPANPFLKNDTAQPQSTTPQAPTNLFTPGTFAQPQPKPQTQLQSPFQSFEAPAATTTPKPAPAFNFTGSSFNATPSQETPQQSFTPSGTPPPTDTSSQESEAQQAEQVKKEAAEKQRKLDEARQRVQEAQRAKQAKEAEQKREAEAAEAAAARQRQEQADRERKAREQQEELARQARLRQVQEEEARQARIREKDSALHALTADVMFDAQEGLLMQFVENAVVNLAKEAANTVEMERRVAMVDQKHKKYLDELKRAGLAKMMLAVQKKKKLQKARERRKRLKEQRAKADAGPDEEPAAAPAPVQQAISNGKTTTVAEPEGRSVSQQPSNSRRAKRTQQRHQAQTTETNGVNSAKSVPVNNPSPESTFEKSTSNASTSITAYSQAYQQAVANAPVDRTETDWFRLRAMGIDPSKHRKRSFDFGSSDEEKPKLIEPKRPKLSPASPTLEQHEQPVPRTMLEEQRARAEAIKESRRRSTSTTSPSQSFNGAMSFSGRSSFNDSTNDLIARARRTLADSRAEMPPPSFTPGRSFYRSGSFDGNASQLIARARGLASPAATTSNVQHDWSRSVPNLGLSVSQSRQSTHGASTYGSTLRASTSTKNRPAYWERTSRFVPRHLYGQGAEAVRAYRIEQGLSKSPASTRPASTEPLDISSPIPTQLSFVQQTSSQPVSYTKEHFTSDPASLNGAHIIDNYIQDETAIITDNEEDAQSYSHFGTTSSYPSAQFNPSQAVPYQQQSHQQQQEQGEEYYDRDQDADSEMHDGDDEELLDYDEDSDLNEEEEIEEDEDAESFDEDDEDEDEDEEDGSENGSDEGGGAADPCANGRPGATEDDAIELSD